MPPKKDKGRGGQAAAPQAQPAAPAQQPEDQCVLCGGHIDQRAEQRLSGAEAPPSTHRRVASAPGAPALS